MSIDLLRSGLRRRHGRSGPWAAAALALALACRAPDRGEPSARAGDPPLFDHHVHVLGPGLLRDWKAVGIEFSRPDEAYTDVAALFGGEAPLEGALLVPMAHVYGREGLRLALALTPEEELRRVRAENEHVAAVAARRPGRTFALASVDLLRPYALEELARMRREHGVLGAKLHLASAGFDLADETHLAALERVTAWCEAEGALLLLHLDTQREELDPRDLRRALERCLGPHPRLACVVAHLGGSGGFGPRAASVLETCARWLEDERARGLPRPGVVFDLSAVPLWRPSEGLPSTSTAELEALTLALRRLGAERLVFGSDAPVFEPREHARLLRERGVLAPRELERVLGARLVPLQR